MFFLLNAPTLLITKGQGSQTICNCISTDCNRNFSKLRNTLYFHWGVEEEEDGGDDVDPPWVLMEAIGNNILIKFEAQYV